MNFSHLEDKIKNAYESGVTLDEAERLASEFLHAQIQLAEEIRTLDLDSRMKKSGVKAIKAAVYLDEATKGEKKPTEATLQAKVDTNELVQAEQRRYDEAEVNADYLKNLMSICHESHVHFRGIAKSGNNV